MGQRRFSSVPAEACSDYGTIHTSLPCHSRNLSALHHATGTVILKLQVALSKVYTSCNLFLKVGYETYSLRHRFLTCGYRESVSVRLKELSPDGEHFVLFTHLLFITVHHSL